MNSPPNGMTCGSPSVPSGSTERDCGGRALGDAARGRHEVAGQAQQGHVVQRRLARNATGVSGVVGGELEVEPALGRGRRVRDGEAVEHLGRAVGGHDLQRPLGGLPTQDVDRLGVHVVEPDVPEPLDDPVDRPVVGLVPGAADPLRDHLVDPAEDRGLAGEGAGVDHAVLGRGRVAHLVVPSVVRGITAGVVVRRASDPRHEQGPRRGGAGEERPARRLLGHLSPNDPRPLVVGP